MTGLFRWEKVTGGFTEGGRLWVDAGCKPRLTTGAPSSGATGLLHFSLKISFHLARPIARRSTRTNAFQALRGGRPILQTTLLNDGLLAPA